MTNETKQEETTSAAEHSGSELSGLLCDNDDAKHYGNEYVENLEKVAFDMAGAIEDAVSIIDDTRIALVNPVVAIRKLYCAIDKYHLMNRDYDGT